LVAFARRPVLVNETTAAAPGGGGARPARMLLALGWRLHAANEPTDRAMGTGAKEKAAIGRERRRASPVRALS